ncbi:hypothetical protein DK926_24215 [Rhodococcus sp. Eu-32]|uniref:hypothetical protein n=1 Tax=Rhodococcus sp. Eu-32 TaxID=1017319 RepID=UPI000DF4382E|nr:hypothetical protein [Rhodococcus sp. Eu-32]RRQ25286.1 hypothetical protein DK926_24215 [Rhodococcus sp. Eu-32]
MNDTMFRRLNERIDRLQVAPLIAHTVAAYAADREAPNRAYRAGLVDLDTAARLTPTEIRALLATSPACPEDKSADT